MKADVVVGLQAGDEAKGKVTYNLLERGSYTHCMRFNGSGNAGHTIYHKGKKFVTHQIPTGVFFGVKSIIGAGCVVDFDALESEIGELESQGVEVRKHLFVSKRAHIIQERHLKKDCEGSGIGSTKKGVGPAYSEKYARTGTRAGDHTGGYGSGFLIDVYDELHSRDDAEILLEGAQGFNLDIDWGDYPYVTSSSCTVAGAIQNGIPYTAIRTVYGVGKCYETYVGTKKFQPDEKVFERIAKAGNELGSTTGRPRQCNWMDIEGLKKAAKLNSVTNLIINKMDVMREVGEWKVYENNSVKDLKSEATFTQYLASHMLKIVEHVIFSDNPHRI